MLFYGTHESILVYHTHNVSGTSYIARLSVVGDDASFSSSTNGTNAYANDLASVKFTNTNLNAMQFTLYKVPCKVYSSYGNGTATAVVYDTLGTFTLSNTNRLLIEYDG